MEAALKLAIALSTLALLTAGCVGTSDPVTPTSTTAPGLGPSESVNGAVAETDPALEEDPPAPPEPVSVPIDYEGQTGTFACFFAEGVGDCQGQFSSNAYQPLDYRGTPLNLAGTVTWDVTSPTGTQLTVMVVVKNGTEFEWNGTSPSATGGSPLTFDFDLAPYQGRELYVDVSSFTHQMAGPAFVGGSVQQPFHLEGMLTFQPDR